jgi:hypothetical protein
VAGGGQLLRARVCWRKLGDFARARFVLDDDGEVVAGERRAVQPSTSTGMAGRLSTVLAAVVEQRGRGPTRRRRRRCRRCLSVPLLDQHGRDRAAALFQLGFDDRALAVRSGLARGRGFRPAADGFLELVEIGALLGRHFDRPARRRPAFDDDLMLQQVGAHARDWHRACRILLMATMIGTFAALAWRIASIVCGMMPSSAATTSTTMSVTLAPRARMAVNASWPGVSMKVIFLPAGQRHLVGADMLGDAAGLAGGDVGCAQRVEQRGLAVVDVAHDGDHRRTRQQVVVGVLVALQADFDVGFGHALDLVAEFGDDRVRPCRRRWSG